MQPWKTLSKQLLCEPNRFLKVELHELELPDGRRIADWPWLITPMRVAMVNGNQDPSGDYHLKRDTVRLQQAGCKISVHMFEGGHQVPPPSVQEKAFRWLLSNE